ncbi:MAG: hypothetical protein R3F62_17405 [Planctomycetota bacterium]
MSPWRPKHEIVERLALAFGAILGVAALIVLRELEVLPPSQSRSPRGDWFVMIAALLGAGLAQLSVWTYRRAAQS